jgi:hypothetical protein
VPGAIHDQELVLEEKRLRNDGTGAARSEQAGQGSDEVEEKNDQISHHRIVAGREIARNYGRNNNSPATRCAGPFQDFYARLLAKGMKPDLAQLTLARKIAAITLTIWKKGDRFDANRLNVQAA